MYITGLMVLLMAIMLIRQLTRLLKQSGHAPCIEFHQKMKHIKNKTDWRTIYESQLSSVSLLVVTTDDYDTAPIYSF